MDGLTYYKRRICGCCYVFDTLSGMLYHVILCNKAHTTYDTDVKAGKEKE